MDYKEIVKERMEMLSPQLRTFVLDENWRREAERVGKQFNFDEEKYASFENEIFLVLLCLEPKNDFVENIKRELGVDTNIVGFIAEAVEKNIFGKVANELDEMWKNEEEQNQPQNTVGTSFEQIILNQAKAMQPARPAGFVPQNLPTQEPPATQQEEKPRVNVPNYTSGDPYREPLE
jgi:hypothetical protein